MQADSGLEASDAPATEPSNLACKRCPSPFDIDSAIPAGSSRVHAEELPPRRPSPFDLDSVLPSGSNWVHAEGYPPRRPTPLDLDDVQLPDAKTPLQIGWSVRSVVDYCPNLRNHILNIDDVTALRPLIASPELTGDIIGPDDSLQLRTKWAKEIWAARYRKNFYHFESQEELINLPDDIREAVVEYEVAEEELTFDHYGDLIEEVMLEQGSALSSYRLPHMLTSASRRHERMPGVHRV